jgi:hypothetical protein
MYDANNITSGLDTKRNRSDIERRRSWVVLFLTTDTNGAGVTDELGLFTLAADAWRPSLCWHSKDGAVCRHILAGTVLGACARVGLGVSVSVSNAMGLGVRTILLCVWCLSDV